MLKAFKKLLAPLERRIFNLVARGVIAQLDDGSQFQTVQADLLADETADTLEHIQPYGVISVPPAGSECVVLFVGGNRDHGVVVAAGHRGSRPTGGDPGDSGLYTDQGNFIRLKANANGDIVISSASGKIRLEGNDIELYATEELKIDAGGTGVIYEPGFVTYYLAGAGSDTVPISPPEIP